MQIQEKGRQELKKLPVNEIDVFNNYRKSYMWNDNYIMYNLFCNNCRVFLLSTMIYIYFLLSNKHRDLNGYYNDQ